MQDDWLDSKSDLMLRRYDFRNTTSVPLRQPFSYQPFLLKVKQTERRNFVLLRLLDVSARGTQEDRRQPSL